MNYLTEIILVLLATLIGGELALRIQLPRVVGQIAAGIILGPLLLNLVHLDQMISNFADLGIIILMMIAGLECDFKEVTKHLKAASIIAVSGVVLPLTAFWFLGMALQQTTQEAILWGVIFSATSVSITVAVLQEMGKLKTTAGAIILGAAVVDDVISIILLSAFSSIYTSKSTNLLVIIGSQLIYVALVYVMFKWLVPEIIKIVIHFQSLSLTITVGLLICFGMAELAELCHLSSVLGAFVAGVSLARTPVKQDVSKQIEILGSSFLIPFFFVSIGLELKLITNWHGVLIVVLMTLIAVLTKWIGCGVGAKLCQIDLKDANVIGIGMISRGEMALIVAQVAISSHLLSSELYSEIILVIILTTVISPILLKYVLVKW
ncbi:cation:proton antiporter [Fructilactobacillus sanfranciscensis]|uniref:cation:proton antiporter n=1 Tax=Fructilactobacillus sanfranciscensis TaxID=1625 RepID=UPI000CD3DE83|nr:cation:proton antiporter [Fructilactobacillus sanfranciscensis]NDR69609.1 cation:proton antiporter [Fructilactobacillus sanfranciscensis]NDS16339.1 cation:proton antiporter [Fructilactobacillus sanfranciscensis]POH20678.1 sodium:proton antiporter [Fructilactobacillus sanfranciscensis]